MKYLEILEDILAIPNEEQWFEFKTNWDYPEQLGEYISAISNAALVCGRPFGYIVWGISDDKHSVVGTTFNYHKETKEGPLQNYLGKNLEPKIAFTFIEII